MKGIISRKHRKYFGSLLSANWDVIDIISLQPKIISDDLLVNRMRAVT